MGSGGWEGRGERKRKKKTATNYPQMGNESAKSESKKCLVQGVRKALGVASMERIT